ncbi:MAG TPA: hypothetical protein VGR47_05490 [Terracidiphilus sp.]|nr:hypothetical protein [Terracidiphilus sp.]
MTKLSERGRTEFQARGVRAAPLTEAQFSLDATVSIIAEGQISYDPQFSVRSLREGKP